MCEGSPSKSRSKAQSPILESLSPEDPVVGVLVGHPGAAPGARVEYLVGKVLGGDTSQGPSCPSIYGAVTSEETGSLGS